MARRPTRLELALEERDQAIQRLAEVRTELDDLRLRVKWDGEQAPPLYPTGTAPDLAPPLRYVVVDLLNAGARKLLRPLSGLALRSRGGRRGA